MCSLAATELLALWEQGLGQPTIQRALLLLSACVGQPMKAMAALSVGQRDAQLIDLQARIFGPQLTGIVTCPACAGRIELQVNVRELCSGSGIESNNVQVLNHAGYEATFRLPTSLDLAQLRPDSDVTANRSRLIELCLLSVRRGDAEVPVCELPEEVAAAISQRMSEAEPSADIQLTATCPECQHQWPASLDIASFLWREIEALAQRLLGEVHRLASAYGWSESDILALSPIRRQFYLSLIPR